MWGIVHGILVLEKFNIYIVLCCCITCALYKFYSLSILSLYALLAVQISSQGYWISHKLYIERTLDKVLFVDKVIYIGG